MRVGGSNPKEPAGIASPGCFQAETAFSWGGRSKSGLVASSRISSPLHTRCSAPDRCLDEFILTPGRDELCMPSAEFLAFNRSAGEPGRRRR